MNLIAGAGWIGRGEFGCLRLGAREPFPAGATLHTLWKRAALLPAAPRNIGRFNEVALLTLSVAALALRDAGWPADDSAGRPDLGLLVSSPDGSRPANVEYFRDYLAGGRTLGRGNLFIYTLPTSAAAETAIALHLRGPLFYVGAGARPLRDLLCLADGILTRQESTGLLLVQSDAGQAACFVLAAAGAVQHDAACSVAQAIAAAGRLPACASPVDGLAVLTNGPA